MSSYRLQLVEPPNLEELGLEPLIDMAFAADLIGMTYDQLKNFLYKNKGKFPGRYRRVYFRSDDGKRRRTKVRVLYPFEIREIRELSLTGPGRHIHNAKDAKLYRSGQKGENHTEGIGKPPVSEGATQAGTSGSSGIRQDGERENLTEVTQPVRQGPDGQTDTPIHVQGRDYRREEGGGLGRETHSYSEKYGLVGLDSGEE